MIRSNSRPALAAVALLIFLGFYNLSIIGKERLLNYGQVMVLRLAPVDPRSLMQGDYMVLDFDAANAISNALKASGAVTEDDDDDSDGIADAWSKAASIRRAVMTEDGGVWGFKRLHHGETLAEGEMLLAFKLERQGWRTGVKIGSGSYFFEEGLEPLYSRARFAELRVGGDGETLIVGLLDENKQRIRAKDD
ncbi:hypothetical protein FACS1894205_2480 [Alphaproteobacteria bacterium]|nr:hypothetical protein FACS1894205_2480 [Alphaproteobacteria bacterium]